MKKNHSLALDNLGKLIDEKLARNNIAIFGEIDRSRELIIKELGGEITDQISSVRGEITDQISSVRGEIASLRQEMNERFDSVDDQFQSVIQIASDIAEDKVNVLRSELKPLLTS